MKQYPYPILFTDKSELFAGAENSLIELYQQLHPEKFPAHVLFHFPRPHQEAFPTEKARLHWRFPEAAWWMGSEVTYTPLPGMDALKRYRFGIRLREIISSENIRLLHINLLRNQDRRDIQVARKLGIPVIGHVRSLQHQAPIAAEVLSACSAIVCTSTYVEQQVLEAAPACAGRTRTIYDPVRLENYQQQRSPKALRQAFQVPENSFCILSIGILDQRKGHDTAIRAFHKARPSLPPHALLLIAGGSYPDDTREADRLQELVQRLGLQDQVRFLGHIDKPAEAYAIADLVLSLTKDGEAFGRIPLEAAAQKKPCIAGSKGATPEILSEGLTGFLVANEDQQQVAARIQQLYENPALREKMGEAAQQLLSEKFSVQRHADSMQAFYLELLHPTRA
ncbi:MAG: glycosyltransferase family 4 protein [Nitritalea sp.]